MSNRLLIVEDELNWQDTLSRILKDEGYKVEIASSYSDALGRILKTGAWFAGSNFSLCTVDLRLGNDFEGINYDGLGILAVCRLRNIPTFVISGLLTDTIIHQLQSDFGVKVVFDKDNFPNQIRTFLETVKNHITVQEKDNKGHIESWDINEIKFTSKQKSLSDDAIDCYRKAQDQINSLQKERIKIRRKIENYDEVIWRKQIDSLDEKFTIFMERVKKVKNFSELDTLHHELTKECIEWMVGSP